MQEALNFPKSLKSHAEQGARRLRVDDQRYPGEDQPTREQALPWLEVARLDCAEVTCRTQIDAAREVCSEVSIGQTEKGGDEAQAAGEDSGSNASTVVAPKGRSRTNGSE